VNVTVPEGEDPVTVAVQTVGAPPTTLDGLQATAVVVGTAPWTTAKFRDAAFPLASVKVTESTPADTFGTVNVTENPPFESVLAVPERASCDPAKVAATAFEAAKPFPATVIVVPGAPPADGLNAIAGTTAKFVLPVFTPSVAATVCDPAFEAGTVNVALNAPAGDVLTVEGEVAWDAPSNFIDVIVEEGVNPVPLTIITSPTWPDAELNVMAPVLIVTVTLTAFEEEV